MVKMLTVEPCAPWVELDITDGKEKLTIRVDMGRLCEELGNAMNGKYDPLLGAKGFSTPGWLFMAHEQLGGITCKPGPKQVEGGDGD